MNLARHSVSSVTLPTYNQVIINQDGDFFAVASGTGYEVWRLHPLENVARRDLNGSLAHASLLHRTSLVFLLGGGSNPLYPPNKLIVWDDHRNRPVLELEFREKILGLTSRRGILVLAFRRRVVVFGIEGWEEAAGADGHPIDLKGKGRAKEADFDKGGRAVGGIRWLSEWETFDNPRGLISLSSAPGSTLLAIPGRQPGHVHLLHLPPCPPPTFSPSSTSPSSSLLTPTTPSAKSSIIIAHANPLSSLSCPPSGLILSTSSDRGTLIRIWDGRTGALVRELRRGTDKAVIWGVGWRKDGRRLGVWSDKGTVHVFSVEGEGGGSDGSSSSDRNRPSTLSLLSPYLPVSLPKYFSSEWSHAQYRLPSRNPHADVLSSLGTSSNPDRSESTSASASAGSDEERCVVGWIEVPTDDPSKGKDNPKRSSVPVVTSPEAQKTSQPFAGSKGVRTFNPTSVSSSSRLSALLSPSTTVEHQLVALTFSGGWYRLALPSSMSVPAEPSPSAASSSSRRRLGSVVSSSATDIGEGQEEGEETRKPRAQCRLVEYRRFGDESGGFGGKWSDEDE